jgi:hypothetical protein
MTLNPETIEQIMLFDWIRSRKDLKDYCFHIANERQTTPQHGRILKRMGVRKGASDVFVGIVRDPWHGLFLELKAGNNTPTESQEQFMLDMASQGYFCVWCQGFEQAKTVILDYLALDKSS